MPLSVALPVLLSVTVSAVLEEFSAWLPNVRVVGASDATGAGAAVPVPLRATVCGDPDALSLMETAEFRLPTVEGANFTVITQLAFAANGLALRHVSLSLKLPGLKPVSAIAVIVSADVPELVNFTVCAHRHAQPLANSGGNGIAHRSYDPVTASILRIVPCSSRM